MATRPTKAAAAAKPKAPKAPKKAASKAAKAPAPKAAKAAKAGKPAKAPKAKGRGKPAALVFEEPQPEQPIVAFQEERPGFLERWRQRRAGKARAKAEAEEAERARQQQERDEAERRQREADEEQRRLREAQEREERKRQERDAEEARKADEAIREAAEQADKARKAEEARARRAAERDAKRRELEAEERRKAEEQAARDAEEEAERRRLAAQAKLRQEAEAAAKAAEPEPDMEFQEPSSPVAAGSEMVPAEAAKGGASTVDVQADLMVAELARRRSKPIVIEEDLPAPPKIPKAPLRPGEEYRDAPAPPPPKPEVEFTETEAPQEEFGYSLPEAFLLLGAGGQWDERLEKNKEGSYGGALAGSLLLELLMAKALLIQRDRFVPTGTIPDDPALAAALDRLRRIREKRGDVTTLRQMAELAKWNRELLLPFKDSLQSRALAAHGSRRHLGLFHRSWLQVTDDLAQERLQNRLRRAIAGGGTPEPRAVLLLGLLDATGQFGTVVPDEAADYNRKRLNGLLGGRDIMGYKVHPDLKALQEIAVRTVLANVRIMTIRG